MFSVEFVHIPLRADASVVQIEPKLQPSVGE